MTLEDERRPLRLGSAAAGGARSAACSLTPRADRAPARGEKSAFEMLIRHYRLVQYLGHVCVPRCLPPFGTGSVTVSDPCTDRASPSQKPACGTTAQASSQGHSPNGIKRHESARTRQWVSPLVPQEAFPRKATSLASAVQPFEEEPIHRRIGMPNAVLGRRLLPAPRLGEPVVQAAVRTARRYSRQSRKIAFKKTIHYRWWQQYLITLSPLAPQAVTS